MKIPEPYEALRRKCSTTTGLVKYQLVKSPFDCRDRAEEVQVPEKIITKKFGV